LQFRFANSRDGPHFDTTFDTLRGNSVVFVIDIEIGSSAGRGTARTTNAAGADPMIRFTAITPGYPARSVAAVAT